MTRVLAAKRMGLPWSAPGPPARIVVRTLAAPTSDGRRRSARPRFSCARNTTQAARWSSPGRPFYLPSAAAGAVPGVPGMVGSGAGSRWRCLRRVIAAREHSMELGRSQTEPGGAVTGIAHYPRRGGCANPLSAHVCRSGEGRCKSARHSPDGKRHELI
jgi:hypothetical protein